MEQSYPPLAVLVWGPHACFTRPEMQVERVSYPMMTPTAARGLLEAIMWKPEIRWQVREIAVLKPIRYWGLMRNEVTHCVNPALPHIGINDCRAQRHSLVLRDVAYIIRADVELMPDAEHDIAKYRAMFRRRVVRGQCHERPYLGCREWAVDFAEPQGNEQPIPETVDLGLMLHHIEFAETGNRASFFPARLERGVLRVPEVGQ
jgi:CRISPR-associated protein Cas5d